jgi:2-iminobutanoate/2-iminopropanoate deaminase
LLVVTLLLAAGFGLARAEPSNEADPLGVKPLGVKTLDPPGAIKAVGTWSLGARAGDFIFVAGMQGVDP